MSVPSRAQFSIVDEVTYGTPVTTTRFFEFNSESLKLKPSRIVSAGLRSGHRTVRNDRAIPHRGMGAGGSIELDVMTKGFGLLFKHMLGSIATGATTDGKTVHTATEGTLLGKMFTAQSNRPFHPADTDQAHTYHGTKINSWELVQDVGDGPGGVLKLKLNVDCEDEDTSTGLASASYPASMLPFGWLHLAVTIGATPVPVRRARIAGSNNLVGAGGMDRAYARGSDLKLEPVEGALRIYEFELLLDFDSLTQANRIKAAVAASMYSAVVLTWTQTVLIGGATFPTLVATIPAARFDEGLVAVESPNPLQQALKGIAAYDGTNSPISIAYGTADPTP